VTREKDRCGDTGLFYMPVCIPFVQAHHLQIFRPGTGAPGDTALPVLVRPYGYEGYLVDKESIGRFGFVGVYQDWRNAMSPGKPASQRNLRPNCMQRMMATP